MTHTLFSPERLIILEEVASTNDWLRERGKGNLPHGTVVQAIHQTKGRGQMGSSWTVAPGENLTVSIYVKPRGLPVTRAFYLSKIAGISIANILQKRMPRRAVKIKWPNDIWVDKRKIAGILIENQIDSNQIGSTILGMGINVNQVDFGPELAAKATSMKKETQQEEELSQLLWDMLAQFERNYALLEAQEWGQINGAYLSLLLGYKSLVRFEKEGRIFEALIEGVEENGRLRVSRGNEIETWDIKEVVWKGVI